MFHRFTLLTTLTTLVVLGGLNLVGCGEAPPATGASSSAPAAWRLATAPEHAVDVTTAKATAKAGDTIAIRGKIGGRMNPLAEASGIIVLMDHALPSCADNPDDGCSTPWDYCCETSATISANAATVQLRDAQGNPIALPEGDLSGLDELIAVGTVAPRPNSETLVLHATGVYLASEFMPEGHGADQATP